VSRAASFRRPFALVRLCERRLSDGFVGRAAGLYGWGIAVSYAVVALLAPGSAAALTWRALLSALTVVGALVAWASLRDLGAGRTKDGVSALACEHGIGRETLLLARAGAFFLRLLKTVAAPVAALSLVALAASLGQGAP
jgi:hypothetical protein